MQSPEHWGGHRTVPHPRARRHPRRRHRRRTRPDDAPRDCCAGWSLARRLDRECIALQRQGELTVYPGFEGQEAAQIGSAIALGAEDFVFPTFRELAVALVRGVDPVQYLQYHRGTWHGGPYDPRATRFGPICIPIATQIVHAVGYALGPARSTARGVHDRVLRRRQRRARATSTRPRTSRASGSVPASCSARTTGGRSACRPTQQTAGEIWKRAEGYGFPGVRVDGNDVLAVYRGDARGRRRGRARARDRP